jgi:hypothetical protein
MDRLLDLDLTRAFTGPVKPKLCMDAIAGLALVNRPARTDAAEPPPSIPRWGHLWMIFA